MLKKIIKNKYQLLELIIIFIITLLYNLICSSITGDEIWNYGFSYNISTSLIPYKDFNMVITPLYPLLGAIFLIIFGKNLLIYHIFNAIICTAIFSYMKKLIPQSYHIVYMIFLLNAYPSYNILCILFLYILMIMEDKKSNNYLIGIILGLTFLTKQNIGIFLCIPSLFTKNVKKILKRITGFLIPNLILLVYLLLNNCLYEFIDYTFLGLILFAKTNLLTDKISIIIIIITTIILILKYIKNKDIKIIYLLSFQLLAFPIVEKYHIMIALVPIIGYLLSTIKLNKKIFLLIFITNIIVTFSVNIYSIHNLEYSFPNNSEAYKYRKISTEIVSTLKYISNYVNRVKEELYIIDRNAYFIKLESNIEINKYDLLNAGNLGKGGEKKIINEIEENCNNKKCIFLIELEASQNNPKLEYAKETKDYVKSKYKRHNVVGNLVVYKNY